MKLRAPEWKFACVATLIVASVPLTFTACRSEVVAPISNANSSSKPNSASALTVSGITPLSGPAAGGTSVTIHGAGFLSGVSVAIGGLPAGSVSLQDSTTIVATTPAHASGAADVTITNSNGETAALSSGFTFHSIDLLWSAPTTSTVVIAGYNVYRGFASSGPFGRVNSALVSNTSFNDLTVQGGTTYYYEVTSVNSTGIESVPAGPVPATTSP